jgi:hypothetical protein
MIWASKDSFCPVGENFQKRKGKLVEFPLEEKKIPIIVPIFYVEKTTKSVPKMNDVIVCVLSMNGG